ncbi:hypothetical protein C1T31_11075 [Hanstruepera neustonica]|uniref:YbbR-like domain-containing protein n=1 Tax=Hanstruepera neustonica TaxID=1445657 RepID=A0A2K1DXC5_9FLAO|nr:CdaR family protein [Hanstruepera neustonica]PNQ72677.1 hypothetical protein C1T31_11075 [Hanstruepera neustonica]
MIKSLKSKIISSIKNKKINIFIIFLSISFGILLLTKLSRSYTNTIAFHINKLNVPEEYVLFDNDRVLNVSLKTQGFNLLKYYVGTPVIDIDFSKNIVKNDSCYIWNSSVGYSDIIAQFDKNVEVTNINPDTLKFKYDINATKKVPIIVNHKLNFSLGYDLIESFKLQPDSIRIIGPEMLISEISSIQTDTILLKDIKKDIQVKISLKLPESKEELKFSNTHTNVTAQVGKFTEGNLKIPVQVMNVPDSLNIKYFPKFVNVSYYTSLQNFNNISRDDFKVECNFADLSESQPFLRPIVVKSPKTVKNVRVGQQQIDYIITE